MSYSVLSAADAASKFQVELIGNGRGTQAVHDTVVAYQANRRSGTHCVKTKATVNRSGKKPWRQKGTGNARAGYASSPVWRGGGVVFGPHPRDYSKKTPKKVKKLALLKAISERVKAGELFTTDKLTLSEPKTATLIKQLGDFLGEKSKVLLVLQAADQNLYLAARNHPRIETVVAKNLNVEQLLRYDKVLLTDGAVTTLAERLKKSED